MSTKPIDDLIHQLKLIVQKGGLELLQRYPDDLLRHDRDSFKRFWSPGQRFAWMVGHSHCHMAPLGIHPEENTAVTYYLNLSSEDRFFDIVASRDGQSVKISELTREEFAALKNIRVPYARRGTNSSFSILRDREVVGHVTIEVSGGISGRCYNAILTPKSSATHADKAALHVWADYACRSLAGSLFYKSSYTVLDPSPVALMAA